MKNEFDVYPEKCNVCKGVVIYADMKAMGITPYQSGKCYYCTNCGAYVGTHQNRPKEALGILANGNVRKLRMECHEEFDKHWVSLAGKDRAYYQLSKELGIPYESCHFGHMNESTLLTSLKIMKKWGSFR